MPDVQELPVWGGPLDGWVARLARLGIQQKPHESTLVIDDPCPHLVFERYEDREVDDWEDPRVPHGQSWRMRVATYAVIPVNVTDKKVIDAQRGYVIGTYEVPLTGDCLVWHQRDRR